tara:strand:- start:965 stop:2044 length:1080 start_codon:yes stop_codon:yes gene_type:complete
MREFIFIYGRDPDLSHLELLSYFKSRGINNKLVERNNEVAIFLLPNLDFGKMMNNLGGIVKIAEVFKEYEYAGSTSKLNYGVSVYKGKDKLTSYLKSIYKKEKVKAMVRKSRNVVFTPSEVLSKNMNEFIVYKDYTARTIAVFDPKGYKDRDEPRPKQMFLHQVSLRLAKILINLSQARNNVLDPFCGVGTVLQEGLVNGMDVTGIDIDKESILASKENLNWVKKKLKLKGKIRLIRGDAVKLTRYLRRNSVEAIVTEPDLGPYYKKIPTKSQVEKVVNDLELLYYEMLLQSKAILKRNGKIALVVPRLKYFGGKKDLGIQAILKRTGLQVSKVDNLKFPFVIEGKFMDRLIYVFEPQF